MPSAVIGRIGIDNVVVEYVKNNHMVLADITNTGKHIHQGVDRFSRFKRSQEDRNYNIPIHKQYKWYTSVMNSADFYYDNLTSTFILR